MKKAKKFIALLCAFVMVLALAACSKNGVDDSNMQNQTDTPNSTDGSGANNGGNSVADRTNQTQESFAALEDSGVQRWKTLEPDTSRELASATNRYPNVSVVSTSTISSLTPFTTNVASRVCTGYYIYETLLVQTGVEEYANLLAKNYYYEDDTTVVFELYDNIYDTDGNHLTASDVVFSYEEYINSGFAVDFDYYDHAEAVDETTVKFYLTAPIESLSAFDTMFTRTHVVTEKAWNDHDMTTDAVGTGPYVLSSYVSGSSVTLEVNKSYWQDESLWSPLTGQNVQTIHFDFGLDSTTRTLALVAGDSMYAELASTELADFLEGGKYEGMYNIYSNMGMRILELLPNCSENSIMNDINLRLACWYALDSGAILDGRGANTTSVAVVDSCYGTADYNPEWDKIESYHTVYDADLAKEYLEKSSYDGETIKIAYSSGGNGTDITAQVVQGFLQNIGIDCKLYPYENAVLTDIIKDSTAWDIYLYAAGDASFTITRLLKLYSTTYGNVDGCTVSFIDDPEFEAALQECASKSGYSEEKTLDLLNYIIDNAYGYATCYVMDLSAWNKDMASLAYTYNEGYHIYGASNWYMDN